MSLGRFGRAFLSSLKENRPETYVALEAKGQLQPMAREIDQRARAQYWNLVGELKQQHPLPKNPLDGIAALTGIGQQANELVMEEVLVPAPDDSEPQARSRLSLRTLATFSPEPTNGRLRAPPTR